MPILIEAAENILNVNIDVLCYGVCSIHVDFSNINICTIQNNDEPFNKFSLPACNWQTGIFFSGGGNQGLSSWWHLTLEFPVEGENPWELLGKVHRRRSSSFDSLWPRKHVALIYNKRKSLENIVWIYLEELNHFITFKLFQQALAPAWYEYINS